MTIREGWCRCASWKIRLTIAEIASQCLSIADFKIRHKAFPLYKYMSFFYRNYAFLTRNASHLSCRGMWMWVCGLYIFFYVMIFIESTHFARDFKINFNTFVWIVWIEPLTICRLEAGNQTMLIHIHEINVILKFDIMHQIQISLTISTWKERASQRKSTEIQWIRYTCRHFCQW